MAGQLPSATAVKPAYFPYHCIARPRYLIKDDLKVEPPSGFVVIYENLKPQYLQISNIF